MLRGILIGVMFLGGLNGQVNDVKETVIASLLESLSGPSHSKPFFILIGGYVTSGKTTLSNALHEKYGMTVFSLNSIRQAMLENGIDIRCDKQEERKILFEIYPRVLAPLVANLQNIIIDANANRQGIQEALRFLHEHAGGDKYQVVKIHLKCCEEELYKRVRARISKDHIHQGTEADLNYELLTPSKKIYFEDYDLIVDTENVSLEEEMRLIDNLLYP